MKLLLDESVPRRLARSFPESFTLHTVQEMGWAGIANGLLLSLAAAWGFEAMTTRIRNTNAAPSFPTSRASISIV